MWIRRLVYAELVVGTVSVAIAGWPLAEKLKGGGTVDFGMWAVAASFIAVTVLPIGALIWYLFGWIERRNRSMVAYVFRRNYQDTHLIYFEEATALLSYSERQSARDTAGLRGRQRTQVQRAVRRLQRLQLRLGRYTRRFPDAAERVESIVKHPPSASWISEEHHRLNRVTNVLMMDGWVRRERLRELAITKCVVELIRVRERLERLGHPVAYAKAVHRFPLMLCVVVLFWLLSVLVPGFGIVAVVGAFLATRGHPRRSGIAIATVGIGLLTTVAWGIVFLPVQPFGGG